MAPKIHMSGSVLAKLESKHSVTSNEVFQCFANRAGKSLIDTREDHKTDPPTEWFIAETDAGRRLKICFLVQDGTVYLKTAYPPNDVEERIYQKYGDAQL